MEDPQDYLNLENQALDIMQCLLEQPSQYSAQETEECVAFSLMWLAGAPNLTVHCDTETAIFINERPELLYHYLFALAIIQTDNPGYSKYEREAEAMCLLGRYDATKDKKLRCKTLKKFISLHQKGKLQEELAELKTKNASN